MRNNDLNDTALDKITSIMSAGSMPRRARLDAPGTLHHVIIRGIEKRKIVDDEQDRAVFIAKLGELSIRTQTGIYAWALMSNHAHVLLRSGPQGRNPVGEDRLLCRRQPQDGI